jgi:hypothetical protein
MELIHGQKKIVAISICVAIILAGIIVTLAFIFRPPPEGKPLALLDIRSGEPFEMHFVSNGDAVRIWLDMACDNCSFPVTGSMQLTFRGETFSAVNIQAGDSRDRAWGGHRRSLQQHMLFDAPPQPKNVEVAVTGTLTVHGPRSSLSGAYLKDGPPPAVNTFRVTVTN